MRITDLLSENAEDSGITLYHGGRRWEGSPEVRAAKQGRYEGGPGLYFTTSYNRARSYAKGGKVVTRITIPSNTRWLQDAELPVSELQDFIRNTSGIRNKDKIIASLSRSAERQQSDVIGVEQLVNLCINYEALVGKTGIELARWLVNHGIDASHQSMSGEDWVVVFNPSIIKNATVMDPSKLKSDDFDLPRVNRNIN